MGKFDLVPEENASRIHYRKTGLRLFTLILARKREFLVSVLLLGVTSAAQLAGPLIVRSAVDNNIVKGDHAGLLLAALQFCAVSAAYLVFSYVMAVRLEVFAQNIMLDLKRRMQGKILSLKSSYFDTNPPGKLSARIQSDTEHLRLLFTQTAVLIITDVVMTLVTLAVMAYYSPRLTLVVLGMIPVIVAVSAYVTHKSGPFMIAARKTNATLSGYISEVLAGAATLQSYLRTGAAAEYHYKLGFAKFRQSFSGDRLMNITWGLLMFMHPMTVALILGFGGVWALQGLVSLGVITMFIMYIEQLFHPLQMLGMHMATIQKSFAAAQRIFELLDTKEEETDPAAPFKQERFREAVEFKNIQFSYTAEGPVVLDGLNLRVRHGSRFAIVGETGGGKSTLINLLLKFNQPQKGAITIDGVDIARMDRAGVRRLVGLVSQNIYVFPGTIMENLKLMDSAVDDSRVHEAIAAVGLADFFARHDLGKEIAAGGSNLSQGERQVLSIVRAMVINPDIIVMDEATSSIDPYTERLIQTAMEKLFKNRTAIIIAHRLATIRHADTIAVMSAGRVLEQGSHAELMALGGVYSKYYRLQFERDGNG